MKKSKFKKLSLSKKLTLIYFGILFLLMLSFLFYIVNSLVTYQSNQVNTFIDNFVKDLSNNPSKYIDLSNIKISDLEKNKTKIEEAYKYMLKNTKITYSSKSIDEEKKLMTYTINSDSRPILDISIKKGRKVNRMGLLTFNILKTEKVKPNNDRGIYYYDIVVPSSFTVKVNNTTLDDKYISSNENNSEFGLESYDILPTNVTYKIDNLLYKPNITILNNTGDEVTYNEKESIISSTKFYSTDNQETAMSKLVEPFDILPFAEKWSLFLTDDLSGYKNGFGTLEKYLIKDSYMWDVAYEWATGIDITFVSKHTLKTPTFTNEKVSDCIIYNDKAFSCLVHLEKNMVVAGKTKVDIMNDRLYFVYYDSTNDGKDNPSWKLVNMKAITEE